MALGAALVVFFAVRHYGEDSEAMEIVGLIRKSARRRHARHTIPVRIEDLTEA